MEHLIKKGLHIYININNYNDLIDYDIKSGYSKLNTLYKAYDLLVKQIEKNIDNKLTDNVYIEKVTDSRIHCVIEDNYSNKDNMALDFYKLISSVFEYVSIINNEINAFDKIDDFVISVGCDYGLYYDYEIDFVNPAEDNAIGYPCNKAAKIQNAAHDNEVLLSASAYNRLVKTGFILPYQTAEVSRNILKGSVYDDGGSYYSLKNIQWQEYDKQNNYSRSSNIGESFKLAVAQTKRQFLNESNHFADGISREDSTFVLNCDIRGFTKKFNKDGSNLVKMKNVTVSCLSAMNDACKEDSKHIQYQGDKDLVIGKNDRVGTSIILAFNLIDGFKNKGSQLVEQLSFDTYGTAIGIGISYGSFYSAHVGNKGSKSPLLLGRVPMFANIAEDKYAKDDYAIALHESAYNEATKDPNSTLCKTVKYCFEKIQSTNYYLLHKGIDRKEYIKLYEKFNLSTNINKQRDDGSKPWMKR